MSAVRSSRWPPLACAARWREYNVRYNCGHDVMRLKVTAIGNSAGVILPKELLNKLNLQAGDALEVKETAAGLTLTPVDDSFERQMEAARTVMDKYKVALQKLAE